MQNVLAGQRVVTNHGKVVTVAFVQFGVVWAWVNGQIKPVRVRSDAWGGEFDQEVGLEAA